MLDMWITFDNRLVSMDEMTHQHMSNIYWYINEIVPMIYTEQVRIDINHWLNKRFDGVILEYRPHKRFEGEHTFLKKNNYVIDNSVLVNGKRIGSLN